jgi:hypothetical protein
MYASALFDNGEEPSHAARTTASRRASGTTPRSIHLYTLFSEIPSHRARAAIDDPAARKSFATIKTFDESIAFSFSFQILLLS